MTLYELRISEMRQALERHRYQAARPPSCTDAPRTYYALCRAHEKLARMMAGCRTHMTEAEKYWLRLSPREALDQAVAAGGPEIA